MALFINVFFLASVSTSSIGQEAHDLTFLLGLFIVARVILALGLGRSRAASSIKAMRASLTVTLIAAVVLSIALSLWSMQVLHRGDAATRDYVALFTALCTISSAACLFSLPLAAYIVVAVGTIPVSVSLLLSGNLTLQGMGANLLLVSPLIIGMIHRQFCQLCRLVETRADISAEQAKVTELAYRDALTGLANRRAFLDGLKPEAIDERPGSTLAIGMVDLDDFKVINDTYGHRAGDTLLVETARRFRTLDIGDAVIARLGGDEFAVLLRDVAHLDDARSRMTRVAAVFDEPFRFGEQQFKLRASIGLACNVTEVGTSLDLINRADLAMYEAKRGPGVGICVFEHGMETRTRRRIMIEQALANPAETDLIELHYQPIVDAASNRIVGFEALARWTHPTLGVISPAEFVPLAEQAGMTRSLTINLLSMALRAASGWPSGYRLSFNLSAPELSSADLAGRILTLVEAHGFNPRRLSIEVTETALLNDFPTARAALTTLQRGGVRVLLDDFGAGYASIGYLREIQFDGIKLDGSLIAALMESPAAHELLVGVLHLCESIGAPVTAEMVETAAQRDMLCALGVQYLQGYYLSRPLTTQQALMACAAENMRAVPARSSVVRFAKRSRRQPGAVGA